MKCVCGYEYEVDFYSKGSSKIVKGDEPFIRIYGTFLINGDDWGNTKVETKLYACPKCNTIIRLSTA